MLQEIPLMKKLRAKIIFIIKDYIYFLSKIRKKTRVSLSSLLSSTVLEVLVRAIGKEKKYKVFIWGRKE